jgi:hypothetical protein
VNRHQAAGRTHSAAVGGAGGDDVLSSRQADLS